MGAPENPDRFPGQRAVIYARISRDESGDELGVARQVAACKAFAEVRGWSVVGVFEDNSRSAYNPKAKSKRYGYLRMLDLVRAGEVDTIVCWEVDRIFRRNVDLEEVINLVEEHPVFLAPIRGSVYDLASPHGRTVARLLTTLATQESDVKTERIRAAKAQHAQLGRVLGGGDRPFGYEADRRTIREEEAQWIRRAATRVLAGESLYSITRDMNSNGVKTSRGKGWQSGRLRSTLLGPRIAGKVIHRGKVVADAEWPGILDLETWTAVCAVLSDPNRLTNGGFTKPKLLSGIARCGLCNHVLRSQPKKSRDGTHEPSYTCRRDLTGGLNGCGKIRIKGDWLDQYVEAAVLVGLQDSDVLAAAIDMDLGRDQYSEKALRQLNEIDNKIRRVNSLVVDGFLDDIEGREQKTRLQSEKQRVQDGLAAFTARGPLIELAGATDVESHWRLLSTEQKRSILLALLDHVVVHAAVRGRNKPDPSRIVFGWRGSTQRTEELDGNQETNG